MKCPRYKSLTFEEARLRGWCRICKGEDCRFKLVVIEGGKGNE